MAALTTEPAARAAPVPAYRRGAKDVVSDLGTDAQRGLPSGELADRLRLHGRNELPTEPPVPAWRRFLAQFRDVLTILLLVATVVSFVAWWIERESPIPYEALTILAIVILNGVLGFVQESRAEQAVAALEAMTAPTRPRAPRRASSGWCRPPELVPGDVLLLEEGDTIAADARVLESIALRVAESALTGESTPVSKDSAPLDGEAGIADRSNMVFSGTAIAAGRGRAVVTATGPATELGRIAGSLQATGRRETPLQRELDRVGKLLGVAVIAIAIVISVTILVVQDLRSLTELVDVLLLAVSLAVAAVPEGLTAITTIVLSLGTQRMAERNVIVRKLSSVETLGSTTTICSDKTGTLTRNEMTVRTVVTASGAGGPDRHRLRPVRRGAAERQAGRRRRAAGRGREDARRPESSRATQRCSSRTAAGRSRATPPRARWSSRRARWGTPPRGFTSGSRASARCRSRRSASS